MSVRLPSSQASASSAAPASSDQRRGQAGSRECAGLSGMGMRWCRSEGWPHTPSPGRQARPPRPAHQEVGVVGRRLGRARTVASSARYSWHSSTCRRSDQNQGRNQNTGWARLNSRHVRASRRCRWAASWASTQRSRCAAPGSHSPAGTITVGCPTGRSSAATAAAGRPGFAPRHVAGQRRELGADRLGHRVRPPPVAAHAHAASSNRPRKKSVPPAHTTRNTACQDTSQPAAPSGSAGAGRPPRRARPRRARRRPRRRRPRRPDRQRGPPWRRRPKPWERSSWRPAREEWIRGRPRAAARACACRPGARHSTATSSAAATPHSPSRCRRAGSRTRRTTR